MNTSLPFFRKTWFRLTVVVVVIAGLVNLLAFGLQMLSLKAEVEKSAGMEQEVFAESLGVVAENWTDHMENLIRSLASQPDLLVNQADEQISVLKNFVGANPSLQVAFTLDANGQALARNDGQCSLRLPGCEEYLAVVGGRELDVNFASEPWFKSVRDEDQSKFMISSQYALLEAAGTGGGLDRVLVMMAPLTGEMFETDLSENSGRGVGATYLAVVVLPEILGAEIAFPEPSQSSEFFVLDHNGLLVTGDYAVGHYTPTIDPGRSLRYTDDQGMYWRAASHPLKNGWAVITQESETDLYVPLFNQLLLGFGMNTAGWLVAAALIGLVIFRQLQPLQIFAESTRAVASGNLNMRAMVPGRSPESDDFGSLAFVFNRMMVQVIEIISGLERKAQEKSQALARRNAQFAAAAQVARQSAQIRDLSLLLSEVTQLVSRQFEFYHTGVFIIDDDGEYAVLRAANSPGGQHMLERNHRLKVAKEGIVGYVASSGQPRIALDVGADAVYFNNPDLPETRSEAALPLLTAPGPGRRVIGVLDVQSTAPKAFTPEDLEILQIVADQVALAIENARLFEESRQAFNELNRLYSTSTMQSWRDRMQEQTLAYRFDRLAVEKAAADHPSLQQIRADSESPWVLKAPVNLRAGKESEPLGYIYLRREKSQPPWTAEERVLVADALAQVVPALENARLLQEIQQSASLESLVGQISTRLNESLNLERVMRQAVTEIGSALGASRVRIELVESGMEGQS